ncbi:MAG: alpha/beta fold hydrolase [Chloroflexi bacterium]|nr:alpha/beta fold hydrolase [Chloroflexota bacterium]
MSSIPDWYTLGYVDGLKHDFRLIMLDPRGQGESDKPHSTEAYTPEQRVDDVVAVLDAAAVERTHFWGYSLGGRVGFDVAVLRPDRLVSVILGGSSPFESPPNVAWHELLRDGVAALMDSLKTTPGFSPPPPALFERWLANDSEALAAAALVERPSLEAHLDAIKLPMLVYCGDQDLAYERAKRAAAALPNATFVALPGLDHMAAIVNSDGVLREARVFLTRTSAQVGSAAARGMSSST